jgi:hypothetical protein
MQIISTPVLNSNSKDDSAGYAESLFLSSRVLLSARAPENVSSSLPGWSKACASAVIEFLASEKGLPKYA